ncbi:MAG: PriCT-2 domain-containing protein, partial [Candidatus Fonsibacter sp.]
RPVFSNITEQIAYTSVSGDYYSLVMGREFKPGRWSILLDFDNKADDAAQSGLVLDKKLNMDQCSAPKQKTPSKGLHYIFYVDAQQKKHIKSRTTITYQGTKQNMDVKFENGLCNCQPSKIEGYGKYAWAKGSAERLKNIPKLPDELFEMIKVAPQTTTPTVTTTRAPRTVPATTPTATAATATAKELQDIKALCCCLSISQLDNYSTWIRVGMILKKLGDPLSLWEEVSKRSKKYKHGDCSRRWHTLHTQYFSIGSPFVLAKEGNADMLERIKPTLNMNADIFTNGEEYNCIEIYTQFLSTENKGDEMSPDQARLKGSDQGGHG